MRRAVAAAMAWTCWATRHVGCCGLLSEAFVFGYGCHQASTLLMITPPGWQSIPLPHKDAVKHACSRECARTVLTAEIDWQLRYWYGDDAVDEVQS